MPSGEAWLRTRIKTAAQRQSSARGLRRSSVCHTHTHEQGLAKLKQADMLLQFEVGEAHFGSHLIARQEKKNMRKEKE